MGENEDRNSYVAAWLEMDDNLSRPNREERLRFLIEEYGEEGTVRLLMGGSVSAMALEEARLAYLNGLFLGCILLCQTCIEHMLAGLFRMAGRDDLERAQFQNLLREAQQERFISNDEFALFDLLRKQRNPYVHPRSLDDDDNLLRRAMVKGVSPEVWVRKDSEVAITALLRLCRRSPFAL